MTRNNHYFILVIFYTFFAVIFSSSAAAEMDNQAATQVQEQPEKLLEVTVLDKVNGEPIAQAQINVRVIQVAGGDIRKIDVTDDSGRCTFEIEDKSIQSLRIEALKNGYVPIQLSLSASEAIEEISTQQTLQLDKGTKIGGLIQDEQGNPIEGVVVSISIQSDNGSERVAISGHEEKTDANGVWVCDIIPEKIDKIMIRFTDPNYRVENFSGREPSPMAQLLREMTYVTVMKKQLNLTGRVLDYDGEPIEGALVAQGPNRRSLYFPSTTTDSQGRYIFDNVSLGDMVLTVEARGYSPETMRFMVESEMTPIVFRLEQGNTIKGKVIDPNGDPLEGVRLSADMWREFSSLSWETTTDANGRFIWDSAPPDELSININKRRYIIIRNYYIKASEKEYVITLLPELVIHGEVFDAETGEPVTDFRFYPGVEGSSGSVEDISWMPGSKISNKSNYLMRFTYPSDEYYIKVLAEGYEEQVSRPILGTEGDVVLDFKLQQITPVTGIVLSPDGTPVTGAEVLVVKQSLQILNGKVGSRPSNDRLVVQTDNDGKFSFYPESEQRSVVILHEQGYALVTFEELSSLENITLSAWARLEGTLRIGSEPGVKETIVYYPQSSVELPGITLDYQTQTDKNGDFVFDKVLPGEGSVSRLLPTRSNLRQNTHSIQVQAAAGQTENVQIGGTGRPVTGKIIIPEQIRARTNWQYIEGNLNINSPENPYMLIKFGVNNDGSFHIDDVPSGVYLLYVQAYDFSSELQLSTMEQVGSLTHPFNIPVLSGPRSDEVLELGEFELEVTGDAAIGQSLIRKRIPGFENITTEFSKEKAQGKSILVCFWDLEQRPSRNCVLQLNKKVEELKERAVEVIAIHISEIDRDRLDDWLEENNITLSIGTAGDNESKVRFNWGIKSLPWLVLTDSEHNVKAEGFGINELDEIIDK